MGAVAVSAVCNLQHATCNIRQYGARTANAVDGEQLTAGYLQVYYCFQLSLRLLRSHSAAAATWAWAWVWAAKSCTTLPTGFCARRRSY